MNRYIYGPIYSRRLGFSLGIDPTPDKECSFACVYCQIGRIVGKTAKRFNCVDLDRLSREIKKFFSDKPSIDYLTISGSGEPTLHKDLDKIIERIRHVTGRKIPLCLITNSSLLYRRDVRKEINSLDLMIPSLDAPNNDVFQKINYPSKNISFNKLIEGLIRLGKEFKGKIWLEIMLIKGLNDKITFLPQFKKIIAQVDPDKVHINLPIRTAAGSKKGLMPKADTVNLFKQEIGKICSVVVYKKCVDQKFGKRKNSEDLIVASLKRRPQTIKELSAGLSLAAEPLTDVINNLLNENKIISKGKKGSCRYCVNAARPKNGR
ncbi:MAG: radical SAM protein [Candidatus Omnitrophota bacterium]